MVTIFTVTFILIHHLRSSLNAPKNLTSISSVGQTASLTFIVPIFDELQKSEGKKRKTFIRLTSFCTLTVYPDIVSDLFSNTAINKNRHICRCTDISIGERTDINMALRYSKIPSE